MTDKTPEAPEAPVQMNNSEAAAWQQGWESGCAALAASTPQAAQQTNAARDVLAERARQQEVEGWTAQHDDEHDVGDLERAAATYALYDLGVAGTAVIPGLEAPCLWPWDWSWLRPRGRRRDLVRAAALLLAAIEKGDRDYAVRDAWQAAQQGASGDAPMTTLEGKPLDLREPWPVVAAAPESDTVPWPTVSRYSGGASADGAAGRVWLRLGDGPEETEYVKAVPSAADSEGGEA